MAGVEKALGKIQKNVESGNYYEAQQMLKTVYHRHRARKQSKESYELLKGGAVMQLQHKQVTCGVELGLLLMEAYTLDKVPANSDSLVPILEITGAFGGTVEGAAVSSTGFPEEASATLDELSRFVWAAVKWAMKQGSMEEARVIHDVFAQHVWQHYGWRCIGRASKHFIRGRDASLLASALHSCRSMAAPEEADLLICRAVLQALAIAPSKKTQAPQIKYAQELLKSYLQLSKDGGSHLDTPLTHFTDMLLTALTHRSLPMERLLRQKYAQVLSYDPILEAYLDSIERSYLGVGKGTGGLGGLMGGLLKDLLGEDGMDEDDDSDDK